MDKAIIFSSGMERLGDPGSAEVMAWSVLARRVVACRGTLRYGKVR